ncbi:MAG: hypothetical protein NTY07_09045 [Bacteroidia bacterium]|nr:hypothetical protein [Bacteroidia bacterium]
MSNFREIIAWMFIFVIPMTFGVLSQKRYGNCHAPLHPNFIAHFTDIFTAVSQIFSSFSGLSNGRLNVLLQKAADSSDKKSGICNSICKSKETDPSIQSLKSGVFALYLYIFFSPGYNSNICTVKYKIVFNLLKPCAL